METTLQNLTFDSWTTILVKLVITCFLTGVLGFLLWKKNKINKSNRDTSILLSLTVCAVILVIKSSLALSLGMVGALSIVRFRTAIKSQEDLVFLFVSIVVGLSVGASQVLTALLLSLFYLSLVYLLNIKSHNNNAVGDSIVRVLTNNEKDLTYIAENLREKGLQLISVNRNHERTEIVVKFLNSSDSLKLMNDLEKEFAPLEIYINRVES